MKYHEIESDIRLRGTPISNDSALDVDPVLAKTNHLALFVGAAGSGKTSLILSLLKKDSKFRNYYRQFDRVYFFSGSFQTLPQNFIASMHPERVLMSLSALEDVVEDISSTDDKVLIIIDDLVKELKEYERPLMNLIFNRRHIAGGVSVWIVSQRLKTIPINLRSAATHIYVFSNTLRNKSEHRRFHEDFITDISYDQFSALTTSLFRGRPTHDFLYLDKEGDKWYHNFNKIVFDE